LSNLKIRKEKIIKDTKVAFKIYWQKLVETSSVCVMTERTNFSIFLHQGQPQVFPPT